MKRILIVVAILLLSIVTGALAEEEYDFGRCQMCHADIAKNFSTSMHYGAYGMMAEYEAGAAGHYGIDMEVFYEEGNCVKCHVTTCTVCHTEEGHNAEITIATCDPCHKKKQTSLYVGDMPNHGSKGPSADIHYEKGLICIDCHSSEEMHGDGTIYYHQMEAVTTECADCHINPGETFNSMPVAQYNPETEAHSLHEETVSCTACHSAWTVTCVNCHLETRKVDSIAIDQFYLLRGTDGLIQPFLKQSTSFGNDTHTGYAAWMPHTTTDEPKDCVFCHENPAVFCAGEDGQIMGEGGEFVSQETIDRIYKTYTVASVETLIPVETKPTPGFGFAVAFVGLFLVMVLSKRH